MKTIGIIGGMSWESTAEYYRFLNQEIRRRMSGHHSAKIILWSVDFAEIEKLQRENQWDVSAKILAIAAQKLEKAGADFILLATNTMHKVAPEIESSISIPFLHIADVVGQVAKQSGFTTLGLLGTRFTMEQAFYKDRLNEKYNIKTVVPDELDRYELHRIIFDELCHGKTNSSSRDFVIEVIKKLQMNGAQAVILGCTEIGLLIKSNDTEIKQLESGFLHVVAAIDFALMAKE